MKFDQARAAAECIQKRRVHFIEFINLKKIVHIFKERHEHKPGETFIPERSFLRVELRTLMKTVLILIKARTGLTLC